MADQHAKLQNGNGRGATRPELMNLYGLTPKLEDAVIAAIVAGNRTRTSALFTPLYAADQADLIERLDKQKRQRLLALINRKLDPTTLTYLHEEILDEVVNTLGTKEIADALPELDSDDAVDILEDLEDAKREDVLAAMPLGERLIIEEALAYPENCAGRLMQREVVVCPAHWTVGQSIDHLRSIGRKELPDDFYTLIIIDPAHRVVGQVRLGELLATQRHIRLAAIMDANPHRIPCTMDQEEVALLFRRYGLLAASVVDDQDKLVGVITVDDIVDVIHHEAEEDLMALGGVREGDLRLSTITTVRSRFLWLFVNLITAIIASLVIGIFDETIERLVALAVLMPIVASMGGNAGTQTVTVAVRALALRQLGDVAAKAAMRRFLVREILVGGVNGLIFASVAGLVAWLWFQDIYVASIMAFAMVANMLVAAMSGAAIPIALARFGVDPAVSSSVFLTTVTDVVGFLTFLGLAAYFIVG